MLLWLGEQLNTISPNAHKTSWSLPCYSEKNQNRNRIRRCLEPDHHVCRLQALTGETPAAANDGSQQTAEDHFRVTVYYTSIDKVVSELQSRFEGNSPGGFVRIARIYNIIML